MVWLAVTISGSWRDNAGMTSNAVPASDPTNPANPTNPTNPTTHEVHAFETLTPDVVMDALASVGDDAGSVLSAGTAALEAVADDAWTTESIQAALNASLIEQMELKPRVAFGPLRVALSGARISPPLFESMEILGKAETLARLARLASTL